MKIQRPFKLPSHKAGSATVIFLALLAIMVILVAAESRALTQLRQEEKFLEQQQVKRLNSSPTNAMAPVLLESK